MARRVWENLSVRRWDLVFVHAYTNKMGMTGMRSTGAFMGQYPMLFPPYRGAPGVHPGTPYLAQMNKNFSNNREGLQCQPYAACY